MKPGSPFSPGRLVKAFRVFEDCIRPSKVGIVIDRQKCSSYEKMRVEIKPEITNVPMLMTMIAYHLQHLSTEAKILITCCATEGCDEKTVLLEKYHGQSIARYINMWFEEGLDWCHSHEEKCSEDKDMVQLTNACLYFIEYWVGSMAENDLELEDLEEKNGFSWTEIVADLVADIAGDIPLLRDNAESAHYELKKVKEIPYQMEEWDNESD
jgi:hypothetical protein